MNIHNLICFTHIIISIYLYRIITIQFSTAYSMLNTTNFEIIKSNDFVRKLESLLFLNLND